MGNFYLFFKLRHLQSTFSCNGGTPPFGSICTPPFGSIWEYHTPRINTLETNIFQGFGALKSAVAVHQPLQLCPILKLLNLMQAEIMDSHFLCYRCLVKLSVSNSVLPILAAVQQKTNQFSGDTDNCFAATCSQKALVELTG